MKNALSNIYNYITFSEQLKSSFESALETQELCAEIANKLVGAIKEGN